MHIYESKGKLTGTIAPDDFAQAQSYLSDDDMTKYLDPPLDKVVGLIEWRLDSANTYTVRAVTKRKLKSDELRALAEWTSGQNSDGLGEGFEQQPFAETGDCDDCSGCVEWGECDNYGMISFDWKTNDSAFTLVR